MNAPETLIKNRDALKQFRQMKENAPLPAKRTRAIGHHQPSGIPQHILKESDYDNDDDDDHDHDGADEKFDRDTDLKKGDASPMKQMKKAIKWANTK